MVAGADHLDTKLAHFFQFAVLAEKRVTALERTKLPFAGHLPGAAVVIADAPGTGIKHRLLDRVDMRVRNVDAQFVAWHRGSPTFTTNVSQPASYTAFLQTFFHKEGFMTMASYRQRKTAAWRELSCWQTPPAGSR